MAILRGYGLVPKQKQLVQRYWSGQKVVLKAGNISGSPFNTERVVTQGDPVSPTISNILVDTVVRAVLLEICGP